MAEARTTVSIMEACEVAGVSRRTVYNWINAGRITRLETPSGNARLYRDELIRESGGRKRRNRVAAGAPADGWTHVDVELTEDDECPIHGDNAEGHCWACHRAACLADPSSCEPW